MNAKVPVTTKLRNKRNDTEEDSFNPHYGGDEVDPDSTADPRIAYRTFYCYKPERKLYVKKLINESFRDERLILIKS